MSYPKWLYHAKQEARVVQDALEHETLGKGWAETPAAIEAEEFASESVDPAPGSTSESEASSADVKVEAPAKPKRGRKPKAEAQA